MSKITERAYNIASAVYPPSDERHLFVKDLVEIAQQKAVAEAAPDIERLVESLATMCRSIDLRYGDQTLADAYRAGWNAADTADLSFDEAKRQSFRALILAALGMTQEATNG